jgi:hypothetical protein
MDFQLPTLFSQWRLLDRAQAPGITYDAAGQDRVRFQDDVGLLGFLIL